MAVSSTVQNYLQKQQVDFDIIQHKHTTNSQNTAEAAHIPTHQLAKAVLLEDDQGYVVTVVPTGNRVNLDWVCEELGRDLELAQEFELERLFSDCEPGAIPAFGTAYGIDTIWDDDLKHAADIYVEAGDHQRLIHLTQDEFQKLMSSNPHGVISTPKEPMQWDL